MAVPYVVCSQGSASGSTSYSVPVLNAAAAGDGIAILIAAGGTAAPAVSSVTDSKSNSYTIQQQFSSSSPIECVVTSPGTHALTTSDTLTVTFASAATGGVSVIGAGCPGLNTVDVSTTIATGSSTAPSVSGTPAASGEIALGLFAWANTGAAGTISSPFTQLGQSHPTSGTYATIAYDSSPTSGSSLTSGATITSATWRAMMVTFKAGGGSQPLIWFTNAAYIGNLHSANATVCDAFFNTAATRSDGIPIAFALGNSAGSPVSLPSGYVTTPMLKYIAYGQFWADVSRTNKTIGGITYTPVSGGIDPSYNWLMYDTENWNPNPPSPYTKAENQNEIDDPWTYMASFVTLAHNNSYKVLLPPARDLATDNTSVHPQNTGESVDAWVVRTNLYGGATSAGADVTHVQAQADQTNGTYTSFFTSCYNQSQAVSTTVPVTAGVSTTSAGNPTATDMFNAASSVLGSAAGFWLNMSAGTASEAIQFLQLMQGVTPTSFQVNDNAGAEETFSVSISGGTTPHPADKAAAIDTFSVAGAPGSLLNNGFEGITAGSTLSNANSVLGGSAIDLVTIGTGSSVTITNAWAAHGSKSVAVATGPQGGPAYFAWNGSLGAVGTHWGRAGFELTALPTVTDAFIEFSSGNSFSGGIQITTTGLISLQNSAFSTIHNMATVLVPGTVYRLEWKLISSATAGQLQVSIYAGDSATAIETYTSPASQNFLSNCTQVGFGWNNGHPNQPITYLDDVALSTSGPIGPVTTPISFAGQAGAADAILVTQGLLPATAPEADQAAAIEAISYTVSLPARSADLAGASDGITVTIGAAPAPTPASTHLAIARPAFIRSQMPRMHVQNLLTGAWTHRDVQGISSPSITWALNAADVFSCTIGPPRADMMDSTGNLNLYAWRDAVYLEENREIKFGGIVTSVNASGPQATLTAMGFSGYANGMVYEGPDISSTRIDALDAVRTLWNYLQRQPGGDLNLNLGTQKAGVLIGAQLPSGPVSKLYGPGPFTQGHTFIWVDPTVAGSFTAWRTIAVNGDIYTIKSIEQNASNVATGKLNLTGPLRITYYTGQPVVEQEPVQPWQMYWYNSTDIGQEIASIQQEAIFDYREQHAWADSSRSSVNHNLVFGVPRLGGRLQGLRFAEGENIVQPAQLTQDGTTFANDVIGLGAGSGSAQIRANAVNASTGRLRRTYVYTDQTVYTVARGSSKAFKVLAAMQHPDTVTSITIKNHPNAPFGSFAPGDDIPVMVASGWRNTTIWSRITQMTQDPTTDLMVLTLARSDSFTYMAQTGQAGTL